MLLELLVSRRNERALFRRGALEAEDEVYPTMRWAYPASFIAMALEGVLRPAWPMAATWTGVAIFAVAKVLKVWAISSLGGFWSYRVLVVPGAPLVTTGPYAFLRHPNYVAVAGEMVGMALWVGAPIAGPVGTLFFIWLLKRRIVSEERALGLERRGAPRP